MPADVNTPPRPSERVGRAFVPVPCPLPFPGSERDGGPFLSYCRHSRAETAICDCPCHGGFEG